MGKPAKTALELTLALGVFLLLMLFIRQSNLDLKISDAAFKYTAFNTTSLLSAAAWIGKFLSVIFCSVLIIVIPWFWKTDHKMKKEAVFAVLLLVLGPGALNNFIFKPSFQRPRPYQIERYNEESQYKYTPPLNIGKNKDHTSFPSGHAGAAFFFIFPWFCLRYRKKYGIRLIIPGFIFGLITGSIRILEGKHFLSDIIASLAVVYLTGTILGNLLFKEEKLKETEINKELS